MYHNAYATCKCESVFWKEYFQESRIAYLCAECAKPVCLLKRFGSWFQWFWSILVKLHSGCIGLDCICFKNKKNVSLNSVISVHFPFHNRIFLVLPQGFTMLYTECTGGCSGTIPKVFLVLLFLEKVKYVARFGDHLKPLLLVQGDWMKP